MKTLIETAVDNLTKRGFLARESMTRTIGGYIDIADPWVVYSAGGLVEDGSDIKTIHHTQVWDFINERS